MRNCYECQQVNQMPATAPLHPWEISEGDWSRLHIDYASPYKGHMFLVIDWIIPLKTTVKERL